MPETLLILQVLQPHYCQQVRHHHLLTNQVQHNQHQLNRLQPSLRQHSLTHHHLANQVQHNQHQLNLLQLNRLQPHLHQSPIHHHLANQVQRNQHQQLTLLQPSPIRNIIHNQVLTTQPHNQVQIPIRNHSQVHYRQLVKP